MNEEAAFIAALVADPSDRTAALVFADWLDERGDPRGPWLRIDEVRAWMAPKYGNPIPDLIAALTNGKRITDATKALALIGEASVPELVTLLSHAIPSVRGRAVKALRMMGVKAKSALPALMEAAKDKDYTVQSEASMAIHALARSGAIEKEKLQEALQSKDQSARSQAARLLGTMRAKRSVTKELAKGLDSADPAERLAAVEAMAKLHTTTAAEALCKALADESVEVRRAAARQLNWLASETMTVAVEPLRKALADPEKDVRLSAVSTLHRIGPAAAPAVPDLLRLLADCEAKDRTSIFNTLTRVGLGHPGVLPVVLDALSDSNQQTQSSAIFTLAKWPALPASVAPLLLPMVRVSNPTWQERDRMLYAFRALAHITDPPPEVIEEFRKTLATEHAARVADVLQEGGPVAKVLLPDLITAFQQGTQPRTLEIAKVIGKLGGEGIAVLVKELDAVATGNRSRASQAAAGLKQAGPAALPVLPELLAKLRTLTDSIVRAGIIEVIAAMGPEAASAVPDLIAVLGGELTDVLSRSLFRALDAFSPAVVPFAPQLIEMLRDPAKSQYHYEIANLLRGLTPRGVDSFAAFRDLLREAVHSRRSSAVWAAVRGLAAVGPAAAEALPDLVSASQTYGSSSTGDVREEVLEAYGKIGAPALPHIYAALADSIWKIRLAAVNALGETGDTSAETMDALRKAEIDASQKVRNRAAAILRKMDKPKGKRK